MIRKSILSWETFDDSNRFLIFFIFARISQALSYQLGFRMSAASLRLLYMILPSAWNKPRFCSFLVNASNLAISYTLMESDKTHAARTPSSASILAPFPPLLPLPFTGFLISAMISSLLVGKRLPLASPSLRPVLSI